MYKLSASTSVLLILNTVKLQKTTQDIKNVDFINYWFLLKTSMEEAKWTLNTGLNGQKFYYIEGLFG